MEENNNITNTDKVPYEEPKIEVVETPIQQDESADTHSPDDGTPQSPASQASNSTTEGTHSEEPQEPLEEPQEPTSGKEANEGQNTVKVKEIKEEIGTTPHEKGRFIDSLSELLKNTALLTRALVGLAIVAVLIGGGIYFLKQRAKQREAASLQVSQAVTKIVQKKDFCTAKYYDETVVTATHKKDELVIIFKGVVHIGFNLEKMTVERVSDTAVVVNMPAPEVLKIITNHKDREIFSEHGNWGKVNINPYVQQAHDSIMKHAYEDGIFGVAMESGKERMTKLFKGIGFKSVTVNVEEPQPIEIAVKTLTGQKIIKMNPLTGKIVK